MALVSGVFRSFDTARQALDELQVKPYSHRVWMETEQHIDDRPGEFPDDYDPIGGARLAGTPVTYPPGTAGNLVGNSVTIDLTTSDFGKILESMAKKEDQDGQVTSRIILKADVKENEKEALEILKKHGAQSVSVDRKH